MISKLLYIIGMDTGEMVMTNTQSAPNLFVLVMVRFLMEAAWIAGYPITVKQAVEYVMGRYHHSLEGEADQP